MIHLLIECVSIRNKGRLWLLINDELTKLWKIATDIGIECLQNAKYIVQLGNGTSNRKSGFVPLGWYYLTHMTTDIGIFFCWKPSDGFHVKRLQVQSPAVATQHLRPAGLGHVNPTTASAWPVLPALPCGEQSKHHVTRTSEAKPRDWWAERAFAPGTNPTLACALGRPRRPRSTLWAAGHEVAWLGAAIDSRRVSPPVRFSLAVNAERHAIQ